MPIIKTNEKKDGQVKYQVRINYTDEFGKYRNINRTAYGLQNAKKLELELQLKAKEPVNGLDLQKLYIMYYNDKKHSVRETSLNKTETAFRVHILPILGEIKLPRLNVKVLQNWKQKLNEKDISITTKKNMYGELRALLNWAFKNGYIQENPINKLDNFRDAYDTPIKDKLEYYTAQQFKKYIFCALDYAEKTHNYNYYVFFNIAFYTGMRKGEINALKWSDIDGDKISVKRSITQKLKGGDRETPPKNKSSYRTIQAPTNLIEVLEQQRARHKLLTNSIDDLRVCGGDKVLRDTTIDKHNRLYAKECDLPHIKIHSYRHSHATLLANNGINIQEIARRLGHSNIEETWNTYSHLYPQEEEKALQVLNSI